MTTQNFYKFYRKVVDAQKFFLTPNRIVITSVKTEIINAYDNDDEGMLQNGTSIICIRHFFSPNEEYRTIFYIQLALNRNL